MKDLGITTYEDRVFSIGLFLSFIIHLTVIGYLSSERFKVLQKPLKQIEVTYQAIEHKKKIEEQEKRSEVIKAVTKKEEPKKIEILTKEPSDLPLSGRELRDISKLSDHFRFSQKQTPKIKTLDVSREISIPMLVSEKINNPKYLSYNQNIREKIRQQAYRHVDHPDFQQGEVYLTFVLGANGALQDLQIIDERTHANDYLRMAGLRSIKDANPFPPFPKDLSYPQLTFNVVISFEVNE
ncbi:MAG TPA: hypothetical protein VI749_04550 [Candidatus Omnitrophota bacterium]|nr:hypothetical protein [Candidatus Omnitrophota bacterium]